MSSRSLYAGLFVVAGFSLSFWGTPASANGISPTSSECHIAKGLLSGQTDMTCSQTATRADRRARSDVRISTIYETNSEGQKVKKGIEVQTITEAGCDNCGVRTGSKVSSLVYGLEQLSDYNKVQREILDEARKQELAALEELSDQVKLQNEIKNCLKDSAGNRLTKEEKLECRLERISELDDEEAEKYFEAHLKKDLEEQLLSGDAKARESALEILEQIGENTLSESLENRVQSMITFSKQVARIDQVKSQAQSILQQANAIPANHPQKQQFMQAAKNQAQQLLAREEMALQSLRAQEFQKTLSGNASNTENLDKLEAYMNQVYMSSPELAQLKVGTTAGDTSGAAQVDNNSRLARGGTQVPGGLLTVIPKAQTPHPQNSSQLGLPDAGRGSGQNRTPVGMGVVQQQYQPIQQVQPVYPPGLTGTQVYNPQYPFGNQIQGAPGAAPGMMLPLN